MIWPFKEFADQLALISSEGVSLSYSALERECNTLAAVVGERCLVFSLCTNSSGSVVGYTAFLQNGIVPLLLNSNIDEELLAKLIEIYCPDYLWLPEPMAKAFPRLERSYAKYGYCLLKTGHCRRYALYGQLGLLLTTSGSTGSPKLVRQSYENIQSNARQIAAYLKLTSSERPVTTLPMNYTYGLSIINSHLLVGATVLLTDDSITSRSFWDFMREQKATSFGGVPYTYEILDKMRFFHMPLPDLKTMTQAGGRLKPELHKKFAEYAQESGKRFYIMYGQAEATARMSYLPCEMALEKVGSIGVAIPGGTISLIDESGNKITSPSTAGELVYEGPNVTLGYAEHGDDLSRGDERHGRLATGDMAVFDSDGYFFICGRKKRFLKIFGNRVNLDDIDCLVQTHFEGVDCASTGKDDRLTVFVDRDGLDDQIKGFLSEKTRLHISAFSVRRIEAIPRNDAGKVLYSALEKLADK